MIKYLIQAFKSMRTYKENLSKIFPTAEELNFLRHLMEIINPLVTKYSDNQKTME